MSWPSYELTRWSRRRNLEYGSLGGESGCLIIVKFNSFFNFLTLDPSKD